MILGIILLKRFGMWVTGLKLTRIYNLHYG